MTFDTSMTAIWQTRVIWGALCEEAGQALILGRTAARETERRIRLETEYAWEKRLRRLAKEEERNWSRMDQRRMAAAAAQEARRTFREKLEHQGNPYQIVTKMTESIAERERMIADELEDGAFDLTSDTGLRDRSIVLEAMAWGYDILADDPTGSVDHERIHHWLTQGEGRKLKITTRLYRPEEAERGLRRSMAKPLDWVEKAAARAVVTDPDDERRSGQEIFQLIEPWGSRGMPNMQARVARMCEEKAGLERVLEAVREQGQAQQGGKKEEETRGRAER